jgi:hypothetical protein
VAEKQEYLVVPQADVDWDLAGFNLALFRELAGVEQLPKRKLHYPLFAVNYKTVESFLKRYPDHRKLMQRFQDGMTSDTLPNLEKIYLLDNYEDILNHFEVIVGVLQEGLEKRRLGDEQPLTPGGVSTAASSVETFRDWRPYIRQYVTEIETVITNRKERPARLLRQQVAQRVVTELLNEFNYQNEIYHLDNGKQPKPPIHRQESRAMVIKAASQTELWNEARAKLLLEMAKNWYASKYPLFKEVYSYFMAVWPVARGIDKQKSIFELLDIRDEAIERFQRSGIRVEEKNSPGFHTN